MTTTTMITLTACYLIGFFLSYSMQRIEHEAEERTYTKGDRVLNFSLSLLSFIWVFYILISTWVANIKKTGYWEKPVNPITKNDEPE